MNTQKTLKAKRYIIDTEYGEVICNFKVDVSNEEIENGIIPNGFGIRVDSEFIEEVEVPANYVEMDFELIDPEEYSARMDDMYADVCPGNWI